MVDQSEKGAEEEARNLTKYGRNLMKQGRSQEAILQFQGAIRIKPDYAEAYMSLGILMHMIHDDNQALAYMQKAISLNPKKKEIIYNNMGMIHFDRGEYETAREMFHKSSGLGLHSAKIWRNIGMVEVELRNYSRSIEAYRKAIENRPILRNLYIEMLKEELDTQDNEEYVDDVQAKLERGVTSEDMARYDAVTAEQFLKRNRLLADDYTNLAIAYEKTGQINEAIAEFRKAIEIRPKYAALYNRIGVLFAKQGRYFEAEEAFEATLQFDPGNTGAQRGLIMCEQKIREKSAGAGQD